MHLLISDVTWLSVCPSVCSVAVSWPYRLGCCGSKYTYNSATNVGDSSTGTYPKFGLTMGGICKSCWRVAISITGEHTLNCDFNHTCVHYLALYRRWVSDLKMKLVALSVILACCLVHVYSDCSASQIATIQQQWSATFGSNEARLRQFGQQCFQM